MENNVPYVPAQPASLPENNPDTPIAPRNLFVAFAIAGTYLFGILLLLPFLVVVAIVLARVGPATIVKEGTGLTPILWLLGLSLASCSIGNTLSNLDQAIRRLRIASSRVAFGSVAWALLAVSMAISAFNAFAGKSVIGLTWEIFGSLFAQGGKSSAGYIIMGVFWTLIALIAFAIALIVSKAKTLYCYSIERH